MCRKRSSVRGRLARSNKSPARNEPRVRRGHRVGARARDRNHEDTLSNEFLQLLAVLVDRDAAARDEHEQVACAFAKLVGGIAQVRLERLEVITHIVAALRSVDARSLDLHPWRSIRCSDDEFELLPRASATNNGDDRMAEPPSEEQRGKTLGARTAEVALLGASKAFDHVGVQQAARSGSADVGVERRSRRAAEGQAFGMSPLRWGRSTRGENLDKPPHVRHVPLARRWSMRGKELVKARECTVVEDASERLVALVILHCWQ